MQAPDITEMTISVYASNTYSEEERLNYADTVKMKLEEYGFIIKNHYSNEGSIELLFDIDVAQMVTILKATGVIGGGILLFVIKKLTGNVLDDWYPKIKKALKQLKQGKTSESTATELIKLPVPEGARPSIFDPFEGSQRLKLTIVGENKEKGTFVAIDFLEDQIENVREINLRVKGPIELEHPLD